jgi:hypothetical protein
MVTEYVTEGVEGVIAHPPDATTLTSKPDEAVGLTVKVVP